MPAPEFPRAPTSTPLDEALPERRPLAAMVLVIGAALVWILLPFYGTILWGSIVALLFEPCYRWLLPRLRGRRNVAALLTLLAVLAMVVLPIGLLSVALAHEAIGLYERLQSGSLDPAQYLREVFDAIPPWIGALLRRFGLLDFDDLQRRSLAALSQGSAFLAGQALSLGQNTFDFIAGLCIAMYLAFFLIRDGDSVVRALRSAVPLAPAHQQELLDKFSIAICAVVRGNLLVAAIQGALGGLAFWLLGIGGALLWAVPMAFLSLLPAIGAALVWLPVAIYLFAIGQVGQGVALLAWGLLVIGLIDNLLRPVLVGKGARLPDYVVMMTTLGGMALLGIDGFVVGPVVAAMFFAVWHLYVQSRADTPP